MSENSELTRPLIDALNQTGGLALRMNSGKVRVRNGFMQLHGAGTADILFFPKDASPFYTDRAPQPVWIETKILKRDRHKAQREGQEAFKDRVEALGHRYIHATTIAEGLEALR